MKRLYRSRTDKKIAGICGGIGELWQIDSTLVRLVFVIIALVTGIVPVVVGYAIAAWIIPLKPEDPPARIIS